MTFIAQLWPRAARLSGPCCSGDMLCLAANRHLRSKRSLPCTLSYFQALSVPVPAQIEAVFRHQRPASLCCRATDLPDIQPQLRAPTATTLLWLLLCFNGCFYRSDRILQAGLQPYVRFRASASLGSVQVTDLAPSWRPPVPGGPLCRPAPVPDLSSV